MTDQELINDLNDEIISLCESKGLSGEEIFIIGAMANDVETIEKFGEEFALRLTIETIKLCDNDSEQIFYAVERVLGIR